MLMESPDLSQELPADRSTTLPVFADEADALLERKMDQLSDFWMRLALEHWFLDESYGFGSTEAGRGIFWTDSVTPTELHPKDWSVSFTEEKELFWLFRADRAEQLFGIYGFVSNLETKKERLRACLIASGAIPPVDSMLLAVDQVYRSSEALEFLGAPHPLEEESSLHNVQELLASADTKDQQDKLRALLADHEKFPPVPAEVELTADSPLFVIWRRLLEDLGIRDGTCQLP